MLEEESKDSEIKRTNGMICQWRASETFRISFPGRRIVTTPASSDRRRRRWRNAINRMIDAGVEASVRRRNTDLQALRMSRRGGQNSAGRES